MTSDTVTNQQVCSLPARPSGVREFWTLQEEAEFVPGAAKEPSLEGKCDRCGGLRQPASKSESGTVRHVDSGAVMDGE